MTIDVLESSAATLAYTFIGGFVVLFSSVSLLIKEMLFIDEVILATGCGVIIGPYVANVFDPRAWGGQENQITFDFMRAVLAIGLFAVGVELPCAYMKKHAKGLLIMVVPTMAFGWIVVSAILHALFPGLNLVSALCIAACLTPTDPVTCAVITRGKFAVTHVPADIRQILSAESAANDGLAYPFLGIAIYLTVEASTSVAIEDWLLVDCVYQVILGTVLGAVLGLLFSKLMKLSYRKGFIDRESYIAQYLGLSIFTSGVASTLGVDDLLAAFAAGCATAWDGHFHAQIANDSFSSVIDYVLNCACFIYIGAWLPFESYNSPELGLTPWRLVVLMLAILALRRIPSVLLLYKWVPEITSWKEALFAGHFGPMGVSAIFVSALALTRLPEPMDPPANQAQLLAAVIQPIVSFVVLGSIIVHGLSIPLFTLGRAVLSRTVTPTNPWTRTKTEATLLSSVFCARRAENDNSAGLPIAIGTDIDVERGMKINGQDEAVTKTRPNGTDRDSSSEVVTPTTPVEKEVVATIINGNSGNGASDVATEPTLVVAENPNRMEQL